MNSRLTQNGFLPPNVRETLDRLQASEEKYRRLFEDNMEPLTILDRKGIIDCNQAALKVYGFPSKESFIGIHPGKLAPEKQPDGQDSLAAADCLIDRAYLEGQCFFEWLHQDRHGERFLTEVSLKRVTIEQRPVLLGVVRDITLRKQAEEVLRQSADNYRSIFEKANDGIAIHDIDTFNIIEVNTKHTQMFGFSQEEINSYGGRVHILSAGESPYTESDARKWMHKAAEGTPQIFEWKARDRDGQQFFVEVSIKRAVIQGRQRLLAMSRDITSRKQAQEALMRSREELRNLTAHMAEVREAERKKVAREIHDELGQTLAVLKMDAAWLRRKISMKNQPLQDKITAMSRLIDGTLETVQKVYSELRPGLLDHLGLVAAMEWHIEDFKQRTGLTCDLELRDVDALSIDAGTATTLFRIFQEALTNAFRHAGANALVVRLEKTAASLVLTVEDNGCGITEAQISNPKAFGLMGIKERVSSLGGKCRFHGIPNVGSTVTIMIPQ